MVTFPARDTNIETKLDTSRGFTFHTLKPLTTKHCNFINFKLLFLAVVEDLTCSKFSLLRKLSVGDHELSQGLF